MASTSKPSSLTRISLALDLVLNESFGARSWLDIWFHLTLQGQGSRRGWGVPLPQLKPNPLTETRIKSDGTELHFKTVRRNQTLETERGYHPGEPTSTGPSIQAWQQWALPLHNWSLQSHHCTGRLPASQSCHIPAPGSTHSCHAAPPKLL